MLNPEDQSDPQETKVATSSAKKTTIIQPSPHAIRLSLLERYVPTSMNGRPRSTSPLPRTTPSPAPIESPDDTPLSEKPQSSKEEGSSSNSSSPSYTS